MSKITADFRRAALRRGIIVRPNRTYSVEPHILNAATIEFANLGYQVTPDALHGLSATALKQALEDARGIIGADRDLTPIYPGFPQQVQNLDTLTLLVEQVLHYWSFGQFLPNYQDVEREGLPLEDMVRADRPLTVEKASKAAVQVIEGLTSQAVAMSDDDKNLLAEALNVITADLDTVARIYATADNRENGDSFLRGVRDTQKIAGDDLFQALAPKTKHLDSLLRLTLLFYTEAASPGSEDDYKVACETMGRKNLPVIHTISMPRASRRALVSAIPGLTRGFNMDRLVARREVWRKIMRAVHPYDLSLTEQERTALDVLHGNTPYRTLNSLVEGHMEDKEADEAVRLLAENQPGNLVRRSAALARIYAALGQAPEALVDAITKHCSHVPLTTLISGYNGILVARDTHARLSRVTGQRNSLVERNIVPIPEDAQEALLTAFKDAMRTSLSRSSKPEGSVGVIGKTPVPLVRRDASTTERVMDRGAVVATAGEGDTLRMFSHWRNTGSEADYLDAGVALVSRDFETLDAMSWDTWNSYREFGTYSGDKLVRPGDSAVEYYDLNLPKLRKKRPEVGWLVFSLISYNGYHVLSELDAVAGMMFRSDAEAGAPFDPRSVVSAFSPTVDARQALPYAFNMDTGEMLWLDSSSGSMATGASISHDETVGDIVRDELRPRLSYGELASLWAEAHGVSTSEEPVDRQAILNLL